MDGNVDRTDAEWKGIEVGERLRRRIRVGSG